jgi:protein-tyrosine phosphatase
VGLVDLHCHVLPGVDDGALDERDSIAMARHAERDGIDLICATPHIRHDHDVRIAELPERVGALNAALERAGCAARVTTGGEVAEPIVDQLTDDELRRCTLGGGGRWILLEPAAGPLSARTLATVTTLRERGFRTVLAHPERHPGEGVDERLRELAAAGALVQLTAAFVLDGSAAWFARERLVHVLASDAHSSHGGRRLEIAGALARLSELDPALAAHADWIAGAAPRAIVAGRDVDAPY